MVDPTQALQAGPPRAGLSGVTVIDRGLTAGERVVIDGQMRVIPGGKVEVKGEKKGKGVGGEGPTQAGGKGEAAGR